jgi:hypothetical protein
MHIRYYPLVIGFTSWCGLGFIRGVNSYDYDRIKYKEEQYMYTSAIGSGMFGIIVYTNPILLPFTIHKELYRLEVNIRKLENDKKRDYYNQL